MSPIQTARLTLRDWTLADRDAFERLHNDPGVAYWLAGALSRKQAQTSLENMMRPMPSTAAAGARSACRTVA